mmetsp:Transcript_6471/g.11478  ORF Transcript_6471/g.11478 Transcript_6471/m.11478 type:complete len:300 (+) Transcript_6471:758-1657(+)
MYCTDARVNLKALIKDEGVNVADITDETELRDHRFVLAGSHFSLANKRLFHQLFKSTSDTIAEPFVQLSKQDQDGVGALAAIRGQYEGDTAKKARRDKLVKDLPQVIFTGNGTEEFTEFLSKLTSLYNKLKQLNKTYEQHEMVDQLLLNIQVPGNVAVETAKQLAQMQHQNNYQNCGNFLTGHLSVACPGTKRSGSKRKSDVSKTTIIKLGDKKIDYSQRVPNGIWNKLESAERSIVTSAREAYQNQHKNPNHGCGGQGRGGRGGRWNNNSGREGRGGRGYGSRGRGGRGRGRGNYHNN